MSAEAPPAPEPGRTYRDADGGPRRLEVESLHPSDGVGREVRGTLRWPGTAVDGREYSCTLGAFGRLWVPETTTIKGGRG